jgi:hypothetical protein
MKFKETAERIVQDLHAIEQESPYTLNNQTIWALQEAERILARILERIKDTRSDV